MNIHDYWIQSLQQQQGQSPGMPGRMPEPAPMPSAPMPAESVSPLVSGARAAQEVTRDSKPSFGSTIFNTLGSALSNYSIGQLRASPVPSARLTGGMMKTLDEREYERNQEEKANRLLALKHLEKQMDREGREAREAALENYRNKSLSERSRHNLAMENKKGAGRGEKSLPAKLQTRLALVDAARRQLRSVDETFKEFRGATKDNVFSPFASVPGVNRAKQFIAERASGAFPGVAKENKLRSRIVSKATRLEPVLEAIEAQKAPGEQMLKRFHNLKVYLSLDQPVEVIEDKIIDIMNELDNTERSILGGEYIPSPNSKNAANNEFSPEAMKEAKRQLSSNNGGFSPEALEAAKRELASKK